jgi:hypothetical protein
VVGFNAHSFSSQSAFLSTREDYQNKNKKLNVPLLVHVIDFGRLFFDQLEVFHPEVSDDLCFFASSLMADSFSVGLGFGVLWLTLPQEKQRIGMIMLCWVSRWVCMGDLVVCKRCSERRLWSWKPGLMFFLDCVVGFAQGGFRLGCYPLFLGVYPVPCNL